MASTSVAISDMDMDMDMNNTQTDHVASSNRPVSHSVSRQEIFDGLAKALPTNELGLPKFLYRADLIPSDINTLSEGDRNQILQAAVVGITYREGYPTFVDGSPIWSQMDTEDDGDYALFQIYLGLPAKFGYRQMAAMPDEIAQVIPALKCETQAEFKGYLMHLQGVASLHFWFFRAKAFDLFQNAMTKKVRERRMLDVENSQYLKADNIVTKLANKIDALFTDEKIESMELMDFMKTFKLAMDLRKEALGLGGSGRSAKPEEGAPPPGASMEITMRQVAKTTGASDGGGSKTGNNQSVIDILSQDENVAEAAQELVIRVGMTGRKPTESIVSERSLSADEDADLAMIHGDTKE